MDAIKIIDGYLHRMRSLEQSYPLCWKFMLMMANSLKREINEQREKA